MGVVIGNEYLGNIPEIISKLIKRVEDLEQAVEDLQQRVEALEE